MSISATGPYADPTGNRSAALMDKYAAPDEVLDAPTGSVTDRPATRADYADEGRCFPVHTPAAAWLSAAHYLDAGSRNEKVAGEIRNALLRHRLWDEWDRLADAAAANERTKAAAETHRYALPDRKRYPLDTADDVRTAAAYFTRHADSFSHDDRRKYASAVVTAADDHRVDLGSDLRRFEAEAGLGLLSRSWRDAVTCRTKLAADDAGAAAALEKASAAPPDDPLELVGLLRDLDKVASWDLPDPLDDVIGETPSTAREKLAGAVRAHSGRWYRIGDVAAVPAADIDAVVAPLGVAIASNEKRAALLADPETGTAFEELLLDRGVRYVAHDRERADWVGLAGG